jgi:colicin import membrane protein
MDAIQAQAVLNALPAKREQIAQNEQTQRKACYDKFAVSSCLKAVAREAQQQRAQLRQEENAAKRVLREQNAKQQQQRVQERAAEAAHATKPAPEQKGPLAAPAPPRNVQKTPPLQGELSSAQKAANEAEHAKRLAQAKQHQAEIEKRLAERATKKAKKDAEKAAPAQQGSAPVSKP